MNTTRVFSSSIHLMHFAVARMHTQRAYCLLDTPLSVSVLYTVNCSIRPADTLYRFITSVVSCCMLSTPEDSQFARQSSSTQLDQAGCRQYVVAFVVGAGKRAASQYYSPT
jgi:hypothetical protein